MDNTQADITEDLKDEQLIACYNEAFNCALENPNASIYDGKCAGYRAVAALARKGWRLIPKDEGAAISLFERRSKSCHMEHQQALSPGPARLRRCPIHGQQGPEAWGCPECVREMRKELTTARASQPVPTSDRPWEQDGWCDEQGRCWMGNPGDELFLPSWRLCRPEDAPRMIWSLPHWAISVPTLGDAS
jgi:hypothetical protein